MYRKQLNHNLWHWFGLGLVILSLLLMTACAPTETDAATPTAAGVTIVAQEVATEPATATAQQPTETPTAMPTATAATNTLIATRTPAATRTPFVPTPVPSPTALPCPDLPPAGEDLSLPQEPLRVIYVHEDNLWLWREGGTAVQLTRHGNGGPLVRFMPDRASVAFLQEGGVWLWHHDREIAEQLTDSGRVFTFDVSDDGAVFYFAQTVDQYDEELWAVNSDGSNLRRLVSMEEFTEMGAHPEAALAKMTADGSLATIGTYLTTTPVELQWLPGSHILAFDTAPGIDLFNPGGIGTLPDDDTLWLLDVDSGERHLALPHGQAGGPYWGSVSFAPDGRTFAIISDTAINLANSDGSNRRDNLVTYPSIGLGHTAYTPPVYWSADSQFLRTIIPNEADLFAAEDPTFTVWQISVDGVATPLGTFHGFPLDATLSPDLSQVAFWKPVAPQSNNRELHIASVDGAWDVVYAAGNSIEFKGWGPDSRQFAYWFSVDQRPYLGRLCQEPVPLVEPNLPVHSAVTWVSGNRVLLLSGEEGNWALSLGTPGGAAVPIAQLNLPYYQWNR